MGEAGLFVGDGIQLPFADNSYDVALETGVLHHVERPELVVREMMRVAKKAVFISDHNIFGQGRRSMRLMKWLLYRSGLWAATKRAVNRGKKYHVSEGDGIAYSYSAYFQYPLLRRWAEQLFVIPTSVNGQTALATWSPLFTANEILLCAVRGTRRQF
jgi:ubiquinone/menaquinone biosynthesis C-methylase UbiE